MWDLLIQNGLVVDGTGRPPYAADVAVTGGVIAAIGPGLSGGAKEVVDAGGKHVTPGFIDMHSHGDCTAPQYPDMEGTLAQGVTTVFTGHCGLGLAPVDKYWLPMFQEMHAVNRLLGSFDGFSPGYTAVVETRELRPLYQEMYGVDPDWITFDQYLLHMEKKGVGANMASVVGHAQLRQQVLGYDSARTASDAEVEQMCALLRRELEKGVLGLSFGLDYEPGIYADTRELTALARVAAQYGGIVTAHVRGANPGYMGGNAGVQPIDGFRELLDIGLETGVHVHISHISPGFTVSGDGEMQRRSAQRTLEVIEEYRARGAWATWDVIPVGGLWYSPELCDRLTPYVGIYGGKTLFAEKLRDPSFRRMLAKEIKAGRHRSKSGLIRFDPTTNPRWADALEITRCAVPEHVGRTVAEIARAQDCDPVDALLDILARDIDTCSARRQPGTQRAPGVEAFLDSDEACLAFDGAIYNFDSVDAWGDLPKKYGAPATYSGMVTYLLGHRDRSIEENIKRMSGNAAKAIGLKNRGFLAEGMAADIVVLDCGRLDDNIDRIDPRKAPSGIDLVVVGGRIAVANGVHTHVRSGRVLRRIGGEIV